MRLIQEHKFVNVPCVLIVRMVARCEKLINALDRLGFGVWADLKQFVVIHEVGVYDWVHFVY